MFELKHQFFITLLSEFLGDIGDLECLACFAFQAIENQFYSRKSMLASKSSQDRPLDNQ